MIITTLPETAAAVRGGRGRRADPDRLPAFGLGDPRDPGSGPLNGRPIQLVANPHAGIRRGLPHARRLEAELIARGHDVRMLAVPSLAAAARWARTCPGDFACLVGVGGDHTLTALAPAAMRLHVPFVPIPGGFANTFARAVGHYPFCRDVPRLLDGGEVRWVDVGVGADGLFLVTQGRGLLYEVLAAGERAEGRPASRLRRTLGHVRLAARILRERPLPAIHVAVEGEPLVLDAALVVVANVPTFSGFLNLTPAASPADGLLDVLAVPRTTKLGLFAVLVAFLLQVPGRHRWVCARRGKQVTVHVAGEAPEQMGILPGVLPVLVPRRSASPTPQHAELAAAA